MHMFPGWTMTPSPITVEPCTTPVGPRVPTSRDPLEMFSHFFDDGLLSDIVRETNRYAQQCLATANCKLLSPLPLLPLLPFPSHYLYLSLPYFCSLCAPFVSCSCTQCTCMCVVTLFYVVHACMHCMSAWFCNVRPV